MVRTMMSKLNFKMRFLSTLLLLTVQGQCKWYVTAQNDECGLYLAVSSTSSLDETTWGIYAGVDIPKGALVGPPDLGINTHNLLGNANDIDQAKNEGSSLAQTVNIFEEYIWVPDATGGSRDLGTPGRLVSAIAGVGFLGAYNPKLTNSEWYHGGAFFRESIGEKPRVTHPGRGAYSQFYNVSLTSTDEITAGSEIFMDYGANWGDDDDEDEEDSELKKKDYDRIDAFVDQMIGFFAKHNEELTGPAKEEIYDFLIKDIINAAAGSKKGKQIHAMLPDSPDDLHEIKETGSLRYSQPLAKRKIEWLKENGMCMDNMKVGASTIPNAGRGAFAKRSIAKGGLVSPVPVLQIPEKSVMNMYEVTKSIDEDGDKYWHRVNNKIVGQQLLLNYCYGHPESSMLLFPAGSVTSFINHSAEKPNVKLVFSSNKEDTLNLLKKTPKDMLKVTTLSLLMEVVALRDIEEGEEIMLDYGNDWQNAWDTHVVSWNEDVENGKIPNPWPSRAIDLNQEYRSQPYPTVEEGAKYPENIKQLCFITKDSGEDEDDKQWKISGKTNVYDDEDLVDCIVTERIELDQAQPDSIGGLAYNYTVNLVDGEDEESQVFNIPHQAIVFLDKPKTSDQFVERAFRHYIKISDGVFPQAWKDKTAARSENVEDGVVDNEEEEGDNDEL